MVHISCIKETHLCKIIPIHFLTSIHAYYKGYKWNSYFLLIEVILSFNYWINPVLGLRRNLDILSTIFNYLLIIRIHKFGVLTSFLPIYFMLMSYKHSYFNRNKLTTLYWKYFHLTIFIWCNLNFFFVNHSIKDIKTGIRMNNTNFIFYNFDSIVRNTKYLY